MTVIIYIHIYIYICAVHLLQCLIVQHKTCRNYWTHESATHAMISTLFIMQVLIHKCLFLGNVFKYTKRIISSSTLFRFLSLLLLVRKWMLLFIYLLKLHSFVFKLKPWSTVTWSKSVLFWFFRGRQGTSKLYLNEIKKHFWDKNDDENVI